MTTHITMAELEAFRRGTLSAEELTSVDAHLRQCRECGARWPELPGVADALLADLSSLEHPGIDELFAYADGQRSPAIAAHLSDCEQCSTDVADAVRERDRLRPRRPRQPWTVWLAAAAVLAVVVAAGALWTGRPRTPNEPPRVIRVTPPPSAWQQLIDEARNARGVAMPAIVRELRGEPEAFRGEQVSPASMHLSPAGTVVVSQQPELRWRAANGERYVVSIVCDGFAAKSEAIAGDRWTPARPIPRGARCVWQLERISDHEIFPQPPAPQPAFRVLDDATLAEIEKARTDDLAAALLYARAGVQKEAEEHLRTYIAAHPSDSAASDILRSIERW